MEHDKKKKKKKKKRKKIVAEQTALSFSRVLRISDFFDDARLSLSNGFETRNARELNGHRKLPCTQFYSWLRLRVKIPNTMCWCRNISKSHILWCSLAFSVTLFCSEACLVILVLLVRRTKSIGGELGGPFVPKVVTSVFLFSLWLLYLIMSTLEAYGVIQGF